MGLLPWRRLSTAQYGWWSSSVPGRPAVSALLGDLGNGSTLLYPSAVTQLLVQASVAPTRATPLVGDDEDLVFFQGFERNISVRAVPDRPA